jgi:glutamyl-tRNA reductase
MVGKLRKSVYVYFDEHVARHMARVASGLDSLVLGESQILGQLKLSYDLACKVGSAHSMLGRLYRTVFTITKQVRTDTEIGQNPVSVAYASIRMAQRIFEDLKTNTALLIGAGETIELVAKHLISTGVGRIIVANRTLERAQNLSINFDFEAIILEQIPQYLHQADLVISSTASPLPILGKGTVEKALKKRRNRPMFMVDIAVPRDIESEVGELNDIYLYTVDDLQDIVADNVETRKTAAQYAEKIIDEGVENFIKALNSLNSVDTVTGFRKKIEAYKEECLAKAIRQLTNGESPEEVLKTFSHVFANKIMHEPTHAMRQASANGRDEVAGWVKELFDLK